MQMLTGTASRMSRSLKTPSMAHASEGEPRTSRALSGFAVAALLLAGTVGCKSGSSMGNSWWSFGMGGPDAATLAEAPPFEGDLTKPSATATPYPTTSTPERYALAEGEPSDAAQPAGGMAAASAATQTPVTYGTTPPPASQAPAQQPPASAAGRAAEIAAMTSDTGPAAQVGPYQTIPSAGAAATAGPMAGLANRAQAEPTLPQPSSRFNPPPAAGGLAGTQTPQAPAAGSRFSAIASQRVAEAPASNAAGGRFSSPPAATAPVAPMMSEPDRYARETGGSRYGNATTSAFSDGNPGRPSDAASLTTAATAGAVSGQPERQEFPAASPVPSAGRDGMDARPSPQLPAPPPSSRRRDPGYRPGGTSSYRAAEPVYAEAAPSLTAPPSRSVAPAAAAGVAPASFDAVVEPGQVMPHAMPAGPPSVTLPPATSP